MEEFGRNAFNFFFFDGAVFSHRFTAFENGKPVEMALDFSIEYALFVGFTELIQLPGDAIGAHKGPNQVLTI